MTNIRYWLLSMSLALAGGFMVVETQAFAPPTAVKIAFAVAIAVTLLALVAVREGARRDARAFIWLPGAGVVLGGWTIVAMNVFATPTEKWLAFGGGLGILGLALAALTLHELSTERVVHSFEVREHIAGNEAPAVETSVPEAVVGR
jgi:hypothetical protein